MCAKWRKLTVVPQCVQAIVNKGPGRVEDEVLVDAASKTVPCVPAHLRRQRQTVVEGPNGREDGEEGEERARHVEEGKGALGNTTAAGDFKDVGEKEEGAKRS